MDEQTPDQKPIRQSDGRWAKGQSGNPGGRRPGEVKEFLDALRAKKPACLTRLDSIIETGKDPDALKAIELVLAYLHGKPKEALELSTPEGEGIQVALTPKFRDLTPEQWRQIFTSQSQT